MKILILGADGYYGKVLSHRLVKNGHYVLDLDNLNRRKIDNDLGIESLIPLTHFGGIIEDVTNYTNLRNIIKKFSPDSVIHLAEQRSAPYSQKSINTKNHTIVNNTVGTMNVLECAKEFNFHLIHIGSMGVYGYDSIDTIIDDDNRRSPGSIYHATKCFDSILFKMYANQFGVKITDLHQGIIWGVGGRFDYDDYYGTVLNRFIAQSMINHPITLYGSVHQQRAFIHIENSLDCIELVLNNQPESYQSFNQFTEIFELSKLADFFTDRINLTNPRIENESNTLVASNQGLINLGLSPIKIDKTQIEIIKEHIMPYKHLINKSVFFPKTNWRSDA